MLTKSGQLNTGKMSPVLTNPKSKSFGVTCRWQGQDLAGLNKMNPMESILTSTVQVSGGGVMVWLMSSWHTLGALGALLQSRHCLNITAYLAIIADHMRPFYDHNLQSSDSYFQQDIVSFHKAPKTMLHKMSSDYHNALHSHQISQWPIFSECFIRCKYSEKMASCSRV